MWNRSASLAMSTSVLKALPGKLEVKRHSPTIEALPGVLGNRGSRAFISGEREQMPNFEGNSGTKTILGNREHKKTNFRFLGNRGTSQFT